MSEPYAFPSIWINGRFVAVERIVKQDEAHFTTFENATFTFIREWLSGKKDFEIATSGSTGVAKKIVITRDQMIASALLTANVLHLERGQSCLICIDTKYIGGRMMLVRALTIGLRIFAVDPCANPLEKIPSDQWVNFTAFVPYQVENLLASNQRLVADKVEKVIVGGAPLSQQAIDAVQHFTCQFYATYGMTETISHVALRRLNGAERQDYFEAMPGITIDLDNRNCLILSVPFLPEKIITNDIAEVISPTRFVWIGRFDNIINTGGIKVNPEKVEAVIQRFLVSTGHNQRFFVHGVADRQLGSRVVLVIEANILDEQFLNSLYSFLAAGLSPYEIPKEALLVTKFSETENGKINRLQTVKGFHANVSLKK